MILRSFYSTSSKGWLQRQARDPYVKAAKSNQYRARSAFKLIQLDQKYKLLRKGYTVIDCGCSPGGWTQYAVEKAVRKNGDGSGMVIGIDLLPMDPIKNAHFIQGDFTRPGVRKKVLELIGDKKVDLVCSDMAPSFSGNHMADHARSIVSFIYPLTKQSSGKKEKRRFLKGYPYMNYRNYVNPFYHLQKRY